MNLKSGDITIRTLQIEDCENIAILLNNKKVWDNLRDYIPCPYSSKDALNFIKQCKSESPASSFAINTKRELCGIIGLSIQNDIYRLSGEVGYWLGEPYWGQGIATKALSLITHYGFSQLKLERIFAGTFSYNIASRKVLEKCGYQCEGIARNAVIKNNQILDEHRYAILKSDYLK